ncbi:MAG: phosphoribosylanthranilate isomerase [Proteobacteria bacterium]|nr:phosphoribosylanthranilate isomerase [Pseudomonadota bacterium]MDA1331702.1 phosphoribosylanthranilate isomerase [Pseudomonadota bacterium]
MIIKNDITGIKICGLTSLENALGVASLGVDAIGLIFYSQSPRKVDLEVARKIVTNLPPFVSSVGLFVNPTRDQVLQTLESVDLTLLQFHGDEEPEFCSGFHKPYIKAVRVTDDVDLIECGRMYAEASGLLLDAYSQGSAGGTGETFDWGLIPSELGIPIVLAGGLKPDNVAAAIDCVEPWAVDVSSGVEGAQKGLKELAFVRDFINEVKNADARRITKL